MKSMSSVQKVYTCSRVLTEKDPVQMVDLPKDTATVLVQVLVPEGDSEGGKYVTTRTLDWFDLKNATNPLIVSSSMFPTSNSNVLNGNFTLSVGIIRSGVAG